MRLLTCFRNLFVSGSPVIDNSKILNLIDTSTLTWDGRHVDPVAVLQNLQPRRAVRDQQRQHAVVAVRAAAHQTLWRTGDVSSSDARAFPPTVRRT